MRIESSIISSASWVVSSHTLEPVAMTLLAARAQTEAARSREERRLLYIALMTSTKHNVNIIIDELRISAKTDLASSVSLSAGVR